MPVTPVGSVPTFTPLPVLMSTPQVYCPPANPPSSAKVLEIIDGNTVKVLMNDLVYVVRYIGLDVPQDRHKAFQAYLENSELTYRKDVTLVADTLDKDASGRRLRYVFVGETFVNRQLLEDGLGTAADLPPGFSCVAEFQADENSAIQAARGMWASLTPVPTP